MAITPEEEHQKVDELGFLENLKFLPGYISNFFVSNIVRRTLAHLVGWTGTKAVMLVSTIGGVLKVAPIGGGYEHSEVHTTNVIHNIYYDLDFANECSRWDIWVYENPILFKRKNAEDLWEGETELEANSFYSFDCFGKSIEVKNVTADQVVHCQVAGWY